MITRKIILPLSFVSERCQAVTFHVCMLCMCGLPEISLDVVKMV